ncbi:MAG: dihydrodipicolinate synthase family protein [Bacillota bacterium]
MTDWGRLMICMVTPFTQDLKIDMRQTLRLAESVSEFGAVVVGDEAGEGGVLSLEERIALFRVVREALKEKGVVLAATFGASTTETVYLTRKAEELGVDGIILTPPSWMGLSQEALFRHLHTAIQSTTLPVMVRTEIGQRRHTLEAETLQRLAALPNLQAVEEATGDINHLCRLLQLLPPHVRVYAGLDELSLPYLAVGAYGVASSSAQLAGKVMRNMIRDILAGRMEPARRNYLELQELHRLVMAGGLPGMLKEALRYLGFDAGPLRPPALPPDESDLFALRRHLQVCRDRGLLFAESRTS